MSNRDQLGWRVPARVWEAFESYVAEKDGSGDVYLQIRLKDAMEAFIEDGTDRADAVEALQHHRDLHGLSSSSRSFSTGRYRGEETKKVQHRIDPDLKAAFKAFADEHDASSYGRMLASALDFWMDGGFERILTDGVLQLTDEGDRGTSRGTTAASDENTASSRDQRGTTPAGDESTLSSTTDRGTTAGTTESGDESVTVDPSLVIEAANELPPAEELAERPVTEKEIRTAVVRGVDPSSDNEIEAYMEACREQLDLTEHPHRDKRYISGAYRESHQIYEYMDRVEATYALRRYTALHMVYCGKLKGGVTYTDVQQLFEDNAERGSPSHDHAYTLMELAGEQDGFEYGEFRGKKKLRVDLSEVPESVLDWLRDEAPDPDLDKLGVNARLEDYGAGSPATENQEAMTDD